MSGKRHLTPEVQTRLPEADSRDVVRFCPRCGREIPLDRQLCVFCENTGEIPRPKLPPKFRLLILVSVLLLLLVLLLGMSALSRSVGNDHGKVVVTVTAAVPGRGGTSVPVILFP